MKELIKHLLENNREEILSKSLMNCHAIGLHSIMLLESPGKTIRLFIAMPYHELWKNLPADFDENRMSIGFHPHHCNITLHCIMGRFHNWTVKENVWGYSVKKFEYKSKINGGEFGVTPIGFPLINSTSQRWVYENEVVSMRANEIHTVGVEKGKVAAWFVYEGKEDPSYKPYLYSNHDIDKEGKKDLYQKMPFIDVEYLLTKAGIFENIVNQNEK